MQVRSRFQVNDGRVLVAAAVAGHGVILQPEAVVADAIRAGTLLPILTPYAAPGRSTYLMFAPHRPHPPKLRVLIDHLLAGFPPTALSMDGRRDADQVARAGTPRHHLGSK